MVCCREFILVYNELTGEVSALNITLNIKDGRTDRRKAMQTDLSFPLAAVVLVVAFLFKSHPSISGTKFFYPVISHKKNLNCSSNRRDRGGFLFKISTFMIHHIICQYKEIVVFYHKAEKR